MTDKRDTFSTPIQNRHYFRCCDCLMTVCIDLPFKRDDLKCGICDGRLEWMGKVEGQKFVHRAEYCACNEICQSATGPKCTCKCGGENHGKQVYYTYVDAIGIIHITPEGDTEKCKQIAAEYRAEVEAATVRLESKFGDTLNKIRSGQWVSDKSAWQACNDARNALRKAKDGKVQANRIKKLKAVAA